MKNFGVNDNNDDDDWFAAAVKKKEEDEKRLKKPFTKFPWLIGGRFIGLKLSAPAPPKFATLKHKYLPK